MATAIVSGQDPSISNGHLQEFPDSQDPFLETTTTTHNTIPRRVSAYFNPEMFSLAGASSPSQVKRNLEAHLTETERRLQDTQKLGQSLLQQQTELSDRLREVNQQQDETEITPELRERLAELEKEHNDVGKEIARALIGPKSRNVSGEDRQVPESPAAFSSNATGSPTKVSVPSRKQRNQPTNRVGDIQFAADISTSLLAQVRQMQAMLAEREEELKSVNMEKVRLEQDAGAFGQRLRALDENEQRYKDENWNLETQNHELLAAAREAADREKRLNASLAAALLEKSRGQNELDEVKVAHGRLTEDHVAAKKAHDSEIHGLKRNLDMGENERDALQSKIDELTMQNQELAQGMTARFRNQNAGSDRDLDAGEEEATRDFSTPEHSPPPSPTKATPRHGGLESETLKSSLHHAHRMIQNLKGNIHREKTEKIELKRMLQEARDELELRRADGGLGSGTKRPKTKSETFKKPLRPEMLGGSRRARTDVELEDEDWEDHPAEASSQGASRQQLAVPPAAGASLLTDHSDSYHTANETEGVFETADEKHDTESEAFQTGAESMAGDSSDELTETEDTPGGHPRSSLAFRQPGNRISYLSTASTSAGEEEELRTPVQPSTQKFRLKNGRTSLRQSRTQREGTPISYHDQVTARDSPATILGSSPPAAEQSLFAELGGFDDASSDRYSTPGRQSIVSQRSTPGAALSPPIAGFRDITPKIPVKAPMVDSGMMTDSWEPQIKSAPEHGLRDAAAGAALGGLAGYALHEHETPQASPTDFPLPASMPNSPPRNTDTSTQYTPQKGLQESPMRNILGNFITPPKTVWDEAQDGPQTPQGYSTGTAMTPQRPLGFSGVLAQGMSPVAGEKSTIRPSVLAYSSIQAQETQPIEPSKIHGDSPTLAASDMALQSRPGTAKKIAEGAAAGGLLATAAAALGFSKSKEAETPVIAEDETSQDVPITPLAGSEKQALMEVSGNTGPHTLQDQSKPSSNIERDTLFRAPSNHQASQTLLTSQQIDDALRSKIAPQAVMPNTIPAVAQSNSSVPLSPSKSREVSAMAEAAPLVSSAAAFKRPTSATSARSSSFTNSHPPLPTDHRKAIARASRDIGSSSTSPALEPSNSSHLGTIMGPPIAPASAYRRPRTPAESSVRSPTRNSTTARQSQWKSTNTVNSGQLSRRSSLSSFASDLDERFNIRADAPSASHGFEQSSNTDPRMIQAITQTMIGEFLFKYTRKPGGTGMSTTRHKRYFWVHPYTKTLYWSNSDPQTAGRTELKAKSVQITSVRVVSDDNPMPPGLHRKSLEIVAPGRKVKVTAPTGQRHETWFNALSYLLLRAEDSTNQAAYTTGGNEITQQDVDEFNVGGYSGGNMADTRSRSLVRPTGGTGTSVSSYNSRGTSANRSVVRVPTNVTTAASRVPTNQVGTATSRATVIRNDSNQGRLSRTDSQQQDKDRTLRSGSVSRFSRMLGSVTGRTRTGEGGAGASEGGGVGEGSIYNASVVSDQRLDSAEELRRELLRQERDSDRLENVRACCDGKHDVSTLGHASRQSSHAGQSNRQSNVDRINRSVNRRGGGTINNTRGVQA